MGGAQYWHCITAVMQADMEKRIWVWIWWPILRLTGRLGWRTTADETLRVPNGLEPMDAHEGSMACGSP